jgi:hypothetical protein
MDSESFIKKQNNYAKEIQFLFLAFVVVDAILKQGRS